MLRAVALAGMALVLAIACGGDGSSPTPSPTPSASPVVILPSPTAEPTAIATLAATPEPAVQRIAFLRGSGGRGGFFEIYVMNPWKGTIHLMGS